MAGYDPVRFAQEFSKRTEANWNYINSLVLFSEEVENTKNSIGEQYQKALIELEEASEAVKDAINAFGGKKSKEMDALKRKLFSASDKLKERSSCLKKCLETINAFNDIKSDKLYEVTQMLNSMMGIVVLPYEMNKEYFDIYAAEEEQVEENVHKSLYENQKKFNGEASYEALKDYILALYKEKRWMTTYTSDLHNEHEINTDRVVFRFLRHMRNAVCHSGNNAISILPLDEGKRIETVMFYDKKENKKDVDKKETEEVFAMWISINELEQLLKYTAEFYRESEIGKRDKTEKIKAAEKRVKKLLNLGRFPENKVEQ